MRFIILVILCVLLFSCGFSNYMRDNTNFYGDKKQAVEIVKTNNPLIKLELLFDCGEFKLYRFVDMAHTRYVAVKPDSISVINDNDYKKGKTTIIEDNSIETK